MKRSGRPFAIALLAAAVVVAGCGGDDDEISEATSAGASASSAPGASPASGTAEVELISANDATEDELQTIPGVGPEIAEEIVEYRPYDAETGPAEFREEMSKYLSEEDVEAIIVYLSFD